MKQFGVGIIGAGWVAGEYVRAFSDLPQTEVRAVASRTLASAQAKAADAGTQCAAYDRVDALLAQRDIDIVVVASPPNCHKDHAIAAAQAGKHLVLEKAMATTFEDACAIRDAVAAAGVKSVVSMVLRWNPLFDIIKAQLAQDAIGTVFLGEVDYFHGIGPWYKQFGWNITKDVGVSSLLSAGCHAVDAVRWFMGGEIVEVTQYTTHGEGADFAAYEYAPTTCTLLRFADGRIGKVTSCIECVQPYVFQINLLGSHGSIRNNQLYSKKAYPGQTGWATIPTVLPDSGDVSHHPFTHEVAHFVTCIEADQESHCNVADALKTHEVCFAADRSGLEGRPIALPLS